MLDRWSTLLATIVYGMLGLATTTSKAPLLTDRQTHGQAVTPSSQGDGTVRTLLLLVPHSGKRSFGYEVETTLTLAINKVRHCSYRYNIHSVRDRFRPRNLLLWCNFINLNACSWVRCCIDAIYEHFLFVLTIKRIVYKVVYKINVRINIFSITYYFTYMTYYYQTIFKLKD